MRAHWIAAAAAALLIAGCAGIEPVGRNAQRNEPAPTPPRAASAPAPRPAETPAPATPAPAPQQQAVVTPPQPAPVTVAPAPEAAPPAQRIVTRPDPNEVVVPGQRPVAPPQGDSRTVSERMEDIRAWDRCVIDAQAAFDRDPMSPQLDTPEELCRNQLGMADRNAVPISRRVRR